MQFVELFVSFLTFILSSFLALSGWFAEILENNFPIFAPQETALVEFTENTGAETQDDPLAPLILIPSQYEKGGPIPRILLRDPRYQQAAVGAVPTSTPDVSLPISERIGSALVNIFCTYREEDAVRATTGSGVFIDPRGVILTNAHVAQFLLLQNGENEHKAKCVVREGSPAEPKYIAELLYISPAWIRQHAELINDEAPAGTGERDYALLFVSEALDGELPRSFPSLPVRTDLLTRRTERSHVFAAGYPAEVFRSDGPRASLTPIVATTTVHELFTFGTGYIDLISIADSAAGEEGSSGGPVVTEDGTIIGLIVTRGSAQEEGVTSLRAITLPYISRTIAEETGFDLRETLLGDLTFRAQVFQSALAPFLSFMLNYELDGEL